VRRAADRLRLNVPPVEPQPIRQHWSNSPDIDVRDVVAAQDSVVRQIASGIQGAVITPTGTSR
jgi:TolB-like protein